MTLFELGKRIIKTPRMLTFASSAYNLVCLNSLRGSRGNNIEKNGSFLKRTHIRIKGKNNSIVFGEKCVLDKCVIHIVGNNNRIILDKMSVLHDTTLYIEDSGGEIHIGEKCLFCGPCQLAVIEGRKIDVGKDSLFSSETVVRTGDSHSVLNKDGERINSSEDVLIGNHNWIGNRAIILKGSKTGDNCIIATGTILTKKNEKNNVTIGGVPGIVVKENTNWCLERI